VNINTNKKRKLRLSKLPFQPLAKGQQLVFSPELMSASQMVTVEKVDRRKRANQIRKEPDEPEPSFVDLLENASVLSARLAHVVDTSCLRKKRHQYSKPEKWTICQFINCWKIRERASSPVTSNLVTSHQAAHARRCQTPFVFGCHS
jgi:hypothetical protein